MARRVRRIVFHTRLRNQERADIALQLYSDVTRRLDEGATEAEVLAALGRPRQTARALRQAVLRDATPARRWAWRLRVASGRFGLTSLGVMLVTYAVLFWQYHSSHPVLSRNFSAEHNARVDALPPEDCGATLYREAHRALEPMDLTSVGTLGSVWQEVEPGDAHWSEARAYIERNQHAIDLTRQATARPYAGFRMSLESQFQPGVINPSPSSPDASNPYMLDLVIDSLGRYREFARVLRVDSLHAAEGRDGTRCVENIRSMFQMATHAEENDALIAQVVGIAIRALATDTLGRLIVEHPDLLTDADLAGLASLVRDSTPQLSFASEHRVMMDMCQRVYTDDGRGNGRMCAAGWKFLESCNRQSPPLPSMRFLGPLLLPGSATRREFIDECDAIIADAQREAEAPMWMWTALPGDALYDARFTAVALKPPLGFPYIFASGFGSAAFSFERFEQHRDATLTLIALEQHRRAHGQFPDSLDALVPEFLAVLPRDRYDRTPIKYRLDEHGTPVLYSVGSDRQDDGGVPVDPTDDGTAAMKWEPPHRAGTLPPGDWILFPNLTRARSGDGT